ncbi:hypothetical protein Q31b_24960 [Novipirellula aureliae]|uniref:DUF4064 domain-containing protein n=1 Tax=Novipirellula aureliae TaxID=2527966 RepID=A0A5C6E455_9BACT|nr:hypothetical protein [Novipirellula aureliae]TWU43455.1 hypothetical protein Q31b_24960 [Novipirellula aureliae]
MSFGSTPPHSYPYRPLNQDVGNPGYGTYSERLKHSGLGIVSFLTAICMGFALFALIAVAAIIEGSNPGGMDEESASAIIVGLCVFAIIGLTFLGLALGFVGIFAANRNRIFPILGVMFNGLLLLAITALFLIGIATG